MIESIPGRSGAATRALLRGAALALCAALGTAQAQEPDTGDAPEAEAGRIVVPLSGTGVVNRVGHLVASPTRVDTGLVEIGDFASLTVTLRHVGPSESAPVVLGALRFLGKSADEYTSDFAGFQTLYPGDALDVGLTFTPSVPGTKSAALTVEVDGATAPYVVMIEGWSRYPLTSDLGVSLPGLDFGETLVTEPVTQTLVLENLGESEAPPITVSAVELDGDTPDAFSADLLPFTLAPGETAEVPVTMVSAQPGTKAATLAIFHDGNNPSVEVALDGVVLVPDSVPISFSKSTLDLGGTNVSNGTSLQFGPDGKLYVAERGGAIHVFDVERKGKNNYDATKLETIYLIQNVPNHDDDGSPNTSFNYRLLTGIHVVGSAAAPVIYAASADPREAAGPSGTDSNLDTNSGILHKLTKGAGGWVKQDLVRGLPRSEENHIPNGLLLIGDKILIASGGHTNQGVPSNNFAELSEYALSAAVLEIDLGMIGDDTYDLPTLDDEDRPGVVDANDPFGGNNGKNQAKLVAGGPVQIYATGYRNAYDLVLTESGKLYTFDNGPNVNWGGTPGGGCDNDYDDGGSTLPDSLHLVTKGAYGGHPNPVRGNKAITFNASNPQSPVEVAANPVECQFKGPGQDGSLTTINASTNGLDEYTASNFYGTMKGDLLTASFNSGEVTRIELNENGTAVTSKSVIATLTDDGIKNILDLTAQDDVGPFPGTIWVMRFGATKIFVLEPSDY